MEFKEISIVIPTYNRPAQIVNVIDHLLRSDVKNLIGVEIIVVDDGSQLSPEKILLEKKVPPPYILKYIRQENAGPAAARNNGFRNASHDLVLFMDDDILAFPDMLIGHIEGHSKYHKSVIFGYCPFEIPEKSTAAYRFLKKLAGESENEKGFVKTNTIASGNISVNKKIFPDGELYKSFLRTPAAEEFELMARVADKNIPVFYNSSLKGWHLQPATIEDKCKQEYKYGIGVAEAALKVPYALNHPHLKGLYEGNAEVLGSESRGQKRKKYIKSLLAGNRTRNFLLGTVKLFEKIIPIDAFLFRCYSFLAGIYVFAGVREGLRRFQKSQ